MIGKPPGVLGTASNPGQGQGRSAGFGTFRSAGPTGLHTPSDIEHKVAALVHGLSRAIGWNQTQSAAYQWVGRDSFTAGVIAGMGENLAKTVVSAVGLVYTLALADYWESRHDQSLTARVRSTLLTPLSSLMNVGPLITGHFSQTFDRKAERAYEERNAIVEGIKHAFTHPKEFLKELSKAQETKVKEFNGYVGRESLAGNFHAGVLMGELLFDLLMVIDLVTALPKLALAVPRLTRYTKDLAKLAQEFRVAKQIETKAGELAPAGPRLTQAEKDTANARGRSPSPAPRDSEWVERDPTKNEKGVYGEAQGDIYMEEDGFQKLNGDIVKVSDDPLGKGIDGVWKNTNPPPEYVISETKYGTSKLVKLDDGTKQMDDDWVNQRLNKAVGPTQAKAIRDAADRGQVEKWLLQVDENGNVTKSLLDENANVILPTDIGT